MLNPGLQNVLVALSVSSVEPLCLGGEFFISDCSPELQSTHREVALPLDCDLHFIVFELQRDLLKFQVWALNAITAAQIIAIAVA